MQTQGSKNRPIEVLDDQEQIKTNQQKIQYERNRQALYKAHMGTQFDVLVAIVKLDIKGTQQQKDKAFKNRILKFFNTNKAKKIDYQFEHFRQRRQPDYNRPGAAPVPNQIILFGVDFLSERQVKQKFVGQDIKIKWLDESNCRIIFESAEETKRGIQMNLKNKSQYQVKLENQDEEVPRGWFELLPYTYFSCERRLCCRYAANYEDQAEIQRSNDHYLYQLAKRQFQQDIKRQVTEIRYLQVMRKYNYIDQRKFRERLRNRNHNNGRRNDWGRENDGNKGRNRDQYQNRDGGYNNRDGSRGSGYDNRNRDNYDRGNRNRYDNRNWRNEDQNDLSLSIKENQRQRSRNKNQIRQKDFDNLSIVSRGSKLSRNSNVQRRGRKMSQSICSREENQQREDRDDERSNYSFILNAKELDSSQQMINGFNNLNIGDMSQISDINYKEEQPDRRQDLSICDQADMRKQKYQKQQKLNTSINQDLNSSKTMQKKKDPNTSIILYQNTKSLVKKQNTSIQIINIIDERD